MNAVLRVPAAAVLAALSSLGPPRAAAAPGRPACAADPVEVPLRPVGLDGTVVGPIPPGRVKAATAWIEREVGAPISPDYADLPRVVVRVVRGGTASETVAAVVEGPIPQPGERVTLLSRYRDPRSPCSFIPWTIAPPAAVS